MGEAGTTTISKILETCKRNWDLYQDCKVVAREYYSIQKDDVIRYVGEPDNNPFSGVFFEVFRPPIPYPGASSGTNYHSFVRGLIEFNVVLGYYKKEYIIEVFRRRLGDSYEDSKTFKTTSRIAAREMINDFFNGGVWKQQ